LDIHLTTTPATKVDADLLVVGVGSNFATSLATLDAAFDGGLLSALENQRFRGSPNQVLVTPTFGNIKANYLAIVGHGDEPHVAFGQAGRIARSKNCRHVALTLENADQAAKAIEYLNIGNYAYEEYRTDEQRTPALDAATLVGVPDTADHRTAVTRAATLARYQALARDLVNMPPADLYPESLAAQALALADLDHVEVEVWDLQRCKDEGCVGIVAVGQGSTRPGVMTRISYRPPNAVDHIALVGKGVTFDAGGHSLKPTGGMLTMRCDMGGAATTLAATGAIAALGLPVAVDTFLPAVENMLDGNAYKLGDILRYSNGVTVEVHNTDAEGRLILADGLIQACQVEGVTKVIDVATLTGAVVVAIGSDFTGLFTHADEMADGLLAAANQAGEGMWRLPLHNPYKRLLKADWGQIRNVGGREAGSITAALFLSHFVSDAVQWAHLDVAGTAFQDKPHDIWTSGATGQAVRTLTQWVANLE
jgi:leucyl aminopeptidase